MLTYSSIKTNYCSAISTALGLSLLMTACSPEPNKKRSAVERGLINAPARFDQMPIPTPEITNSLMKLFSDRDLNRFVKTALKKNLNLQTSLARLEEAGFNTQKNTSSGAPNVSVSGSSGKIRNASFGGGGASPQANNRFSASLDAQWELDLWGRIRAGNTAARQSQLAIEADHAALRQSVAAQTMQAYFSLVTSDKLLDLAQRRLVSLKSTLKLINDRFERGSSTLANLNSAKSEMEAGAAQLQRQKNQRDQAARQLAALTGNYPNARLTQSIWPKLPKNLPVGIPSDLLMARPDIDAAYKRILASDSNLYVAQRDIYPRFSLTASVGRQSSVLQDLADSNFSVWSIVGNLTAPIIDGGRRRAEVGASKARVKQAISQYQSTVLKAFQEVENGIGSEISLEAEQAALSKSLKSAKLSADLTRQRYESGLVEVLTLLESQRRSFNTEEALINATNRRFQNRVSLALALGKGL